MLINVNPILIFRGGNKGTWYLSSLLYVTQLEQAAGMIGIPTVEFQSPHNYSQHRDQNHFINILHQEEKQLT